MRTKTASVVLISTFLSMTACSKGNSVSESMETSSAAGQIERSNLLEAFKNYQNTLTSTELASGNCVERATKFYNLALPNVINPEKLSIVLMMKEPDSRGAPMPLFPNVDYFVEGQPKQVWIWHAFVIYENVVFDVIDRLSPQTNEQYLKNFWTINDVSSEGTDLFIYVTDPAGLGIIQQRLKRDSIFGIAELKRRLISLDPLKIDELVEPEIRKSVF